MFSWLGLRESERTPFVEAILTVDVKARRDERVLAKTQADRAHELIAHRRIRFPQNGGTWKPHCPFLPRRDLPKPWSSGSLRLLDIIHMIQNSLKSEGGVGRKERGLGRIHLQPATSLLLKLVPA